MATKHLLPLDHSKKKLFIILYMLLVLNIRHSENKMLQNVLYSHTL